MPKEAPPPASKLGRIKSGAMSRGLALARVSVGAGAKAASHAIGNVFASDADKPERLKAMLIAQMSTLAREFGELKGSFMKIGQMISVYGEQMLPPEANAILKSLQSDSPALEWKAIEKVLKRQIPPERLAELEIDTEPCASASLGQVHRAIRKRDGRAIALKVQYPGVDEAIESDLRALKRVLGLARVIPKGPRFDELFKEIRQMLRQEVDYRRECEETDLFRADLPSDPRYIVPLTYPEYSSGRVLATGFEEGVKVDDPRIAALSQERRDRLGEAMLELYFKELFELHRMQTDPHFGNYRIRLGKDGGSDQIILFDFGAVRRFPKKFLDPYFQMIQGAYQRDQDGVIRGATGLGFMREDDSPELRRDFAELCFLIGEPFADPGTLSKESRIRRSLFDENGAYDWGSSDLLQRVKQQGMRIALSFGLRAPPREIVFLDRKMGGVFIWLSVLRARVRGRDVLSRYFDASGA